MTPTCLTCAKPVGGSYVCAQCALPAMRALTVIADLAQDVTATITRQARHGDHSGPGGTSSELPVNLKAGQVAAAIETTIVTWARHVSTHNGVTIPRAARVQGPVCGKGIDCGHPSCDTIRRRIVDPAMRRAAQWLHGQVDWLRHQRESVEAFRDFDQAAKELRWLLDGPTPRWYAGPCNSDAAQAHACPCHCHGGGLDRICNIVGGCGSEGCDGHGTITTPAGQCGTDLYARPGATTITCPACKWTYDAAARRDWLLAAANDHLAHAELIGRAIAALGLECTPATVHGMARHGRLIAHGRDTAGRDTYRLGDVLDLLEERDRMKAERDARAKARAERRAAKDEAA